MKTDKIEIKGRGSQINTKNKFLQQEYVTEHFEGLDEPFITDSKTEYLDEFPKKIVNAVNSPDLRFKYSMNPYQGCEHGCIYCYARNTHQYWGYSAGLDFERKIIVKRNAPDLLEQFLINYKGVPEPIVLSGNTDCYQPIERKLKITRKMLEHLLKFKYPVSMITKNRLIIRDIDILQELAALELVNVSISITSLDKELQQKLEPRTATAANRLHAVNALSTAGIPVNVMVAPVIPGLNSHEIPKIIKAAADNGASSAAYTIVRLNGVINQLFKDWIIKAYPNRARKVLNQIAECHSGKLNDSRWGKRMKGDGTTAAIISDMFHIASKKYFRNRVLKPLNTSLFSKSNSGQLDLFQCFI